MLILTYISEIIDQRAYLGIFVQCWFLPCLVAMYTLPAGASRWSSYAAVTVLLSYPTPHPMQVAWISRNSNAVRARTVSAALYNMAVQLQIIISSNVYREDDKPYYRRGNRILLSMACVNIVIYLGAKAYYTWRNKQKSAKWNVLSEQEKIQYNETTTDQGAKRRDFQFVS